MKSNALAVSHRCTPTHGVDRAEAVGTGARESLAGDSAIVHRVDGGESSLVGHHVFLERGASVAVEVRRLCLSTAPGGRRRRLSALDPRLQCGDAGFLKVRLHGSRDGERLLVVRIGGVDLPVGVEHLRQRLVHGR